MFYLQAYDIAKAEHAARLAQLSRRPAPDSMRVMAPSIVQRILALLRKLLPAQPRRGTRRIAGALAR
ncbi:MAG: hypothetical protein M1546_19865 [Chloroflexi bacterium]|nr:hypothetical protein [Chloroflexota bacterium]